MFKVYNIIKTKNKEITRFINRKRDITIKLVVNIVYLEIILEKKFYSIFYTKLSTTNINSSLDKSFKVNKFWFFNQIFK